MPFHRAIPESKPPDKNSAGMKGYIEAEKLINLAFVMPAAVAICGGVGWWAGQHLHQHWMTIAGIIFGCVAGLFYVIQQAVAAEKNSQAEDAARNGTDEGHGDRKP